MYIFCAFLGFMNVVTGVIVDIIRQPLPSDRATRIAAENREMKALEKLFSNELRRLGKTKAEATMPRKVFDKFVNSPPIAARLRLLMLAAHCRARTRECHGSWRVCVRVTSSDSEQAARCRRGGRREGVGISHSSWSEPPECDFATLRDLETDSGPPPMRCGLAHVARADHAVRVSPCGACSPLCGQSRRCGQSRQCGQPMRHGQGPNPTDRTPGRP